MFETHEQARVENPFFVLEEGTRRWKYVSQTSNDEWFFVTYEVAGEEGSSQQQFLISKVQFLLGLVSRDGPDQFVREVQLVSPPWLNQKGRWLMEPIREIQTVGELFCYELMGGQVYPSKMQGKSRDPVWSKEARTNE
ncbi:hypothetical protein ACYZT4_17450 [Pseudomonas sp. GB2N2]